MFIPNNSLPLSKLVQGSNIGFYVNNSYTSSNISLYPGINISTDTIAYMKYTSSSNIILASLTGTS